MAVILRIVHIDDYITDVKGIISTETPPAKIVSDDQYRVQEVTRKIGDRVRKGEVIAVLDGRERQVELARVKQALQAKERELAFTGQRVEVLQSKRSSIERTIANRRQLALLANAETQTSIELEAERRSAVERITALSKNILQRAIPAIESNALSEVDKLKLLSTTHAELRQMHQMSVEYAANRTRIQRERISTGIAIEELMGVKLNVDVEIADALRLAGQIEGEVVVLARQRDALQAALARLEVRSPISGIISRMSDNLSTANLVQRADELFLIHDDRSRIEGELVLSDEQYKDAFVGQRVRMQFRAWNHYKYGTLEGRITAISRRKMVPRTYPTPNAMYVARVELLTKGKERVEVGYLFEAKLLLANVPLLHYLLKKVRIG